MTGQGEKIEAKTGVIALSRDGQKWETVFEGGRVTENFSHGNNNMVRGIASGHAGYVATGNPGIGIMFSEDGRGWEYVSEMGDKLGGFNVAYGGGIYLIARAADLLRSEDGRSWTRHETKEEGRPVYGEGGLGHMRQVVYGNGSFVCLGDNRLAVTRTGKAYEHVHFHSNDGFQGRQSLVFGDGRFLWLRTGGHLTSTDGIEWEPLEIEPNSSPKTRLRHVTGTCFDGDRFLAGSVNGLFVSTNGLTWERIESKGYLRCIAAGNGAIVGKGRTSVDGGKTWIKTDPGVHQREIVFFPTDS